MYPLIKRIQVQHRIVKPLMFIGLISLVFFISLAIKTPTSSNSFENELTIIVNNDLRLKSDVSSTTNERTVGLSKYDSLRPNESMLFIFEEKGLYSFWMRNMKFPIDIIWLNENKEVVSIKENADPADYPQSYGPDDDSLYVLETVAGFASENSIALGDQMSW